MFSLKLCFRISKISVSNICRSYKTAHFLRRLGLETQQLKKFRTEYKLENLTEDQMDDVIEFCESVGISKEDIRKNANLLKVNIGKLDSQYTLMQEFGFKNINAFVLSKFSTCMSRSVSILKAHKFIDEETNVVDNLIRSLKPAPEKIKTDDLSDDNILLEIHRTLLIRYLSWRFNKSEYQIESFLRKSVFKIKSFRFLCECIALAKDLGIPEDKLLNQYRYFLAAYPKFILKPIKEMQSICGMKITELYQREPHLVTIHPKTLLANKLILEENNISKAALLGCIRVLMCCPSTLKIRFKEINDIPELRVFKGLPGAIKLIAHHKRARSRLAFLKSLNLNCTSLGILGNKEEAFHNHISFGNDKNSIHDVKNVFEDLLKIDYKSISGEMKKHPYFLKVPLFQIQETYEFLKNKGFHIPTIIKVIHILLYPKGKIMKAFSDIKNHDYIKSLEISQEEILSLALYFIEKRYHFTSNGIWIKD